MRYLFAIMTLSIATASGFAQVFPPQLSDLKDAKPEKYLRKVKEMPQPVLDALRKAMPSKEFKIADSGDKWNKTDAVDDPSLPFRRLIWAVMVNGRYVVHYEMGGIGWSTHYLIVAPDEKGEKWAVVWSASSFNTARDYPAFIAELQKGKLDTDTSVSH